MQVLKTSLLLTSLLCFSTAIKAQSYRTDSIANNQIHIPFTISYFTNFLVDPGVKIGLERPILTMNKSKIKKNGTIKIFQQQFLNTLNLGYFSTKEHNHSLFLNGEFGYRKTRRSGFKTETFIGLGYLRTYLKGETYEVDETGNVVLVQNAGSNYVMPSVSFGIGYDHSSKHQNIPFAFSLRPTLFFRFPYNKTVLPQFAIELNFSYRLQALWQNSKVIYKSK
ncbi:MAG: hypothetical protein WBO36_04880 [Saprospiraceae bacterium]